LDKKYTGKLMSLLLSIRWALSVWSIHFIGLSN